MAYPTTDNLKTYLGITGTADNTRLGYILNEVIDWVEDYTSRKFVIAGDTTVKFPVQYPYVSADGLTLIMRGKEVVSVTTLTLTDAQVPSAADFFLAPIGEAPYSSINLFSGGVYRFSSAYDNTMITVLGKFGYSETCPNAIFGVILQISQYLWTIRKTGGGGSNAASAAGGKIGIAPAELDKTVLAILNTYRR